MKTYHSVKNILFINLITTSQEQSLQNVDNKLKKLWLEKVERQSLDPDMDPELYYQEKAAYQAEFGKIVAIGIGYFAINEDKALNFRLKCICEQDEASTLATFKSLILRFDETSLRLCSHNGREFTFPYLCKRMLINGVSLPEPLMIHGKKPWEIQHIDTLVLWRFGDFKNYTSLKTLAAIFDLTPHINPENTLSVKHLHQHRDNLHEICAYCKEEVILVAQVYLKLLNLDILTESQIIYVP